ncbi:MAG: riboflavin synthase [Candidatus Sumerlaeia bacterium]|nr:riboflavin synthase [Candidatus Sumerlaeia bacterium]
MFTGLIETLGTIDSLSNSGRGARASVSARFAGEPLALGESIAVDGACLTVESILPGGFAAFASDETLRKTTLGARRPGDAVNLERALPLGARLGGHLVSGHIDGAGSFLSAKPVDEAWELWVGLPAELARQCIAKGSLAVDGVSLTIAELRADRASFWIIPETWKRTTLSLRRPGEAVNIETDLIGKYVFRFLETQGGTAGASDDRMRALLSGGGWGAR